MSRLYLPRIAIRVDPPHIDEGPELTVRGSYVCDDRESVREISILAAGRPQHYRVLADIIEAVNAIARDLVPEAFNAGARAPAPGLEERHAALLAQAASARARVIARFEVCRCAYPYIRARTVSGHPLDCPAHLVHVQDTAPAVLVP